MNSIIVITILVLNGFTLITLADKNNQEHPNINIEVNQFQEDITISYKINSFTEKTITINNQSYKQILLDDESPILKRGYPDLPNIRRSIVIPDNQVMAVSVLSSTFQEYENIAVAPSKGSFTRNIDPSSVPYTFAEIYQQNDWFPQNIATLNDPYILRDFRGQIVEFNPFQYNPSTNTLRFYTEVTIQISPNGVGGENMYVRDNPPQILDPTFKNIYERHFLNFDSFTQQTKYTTIEEDGELLVISYDTFYSTVEPLVQWKKLKGIPTTHLNLSDIGSTATDIENYIDSYYASHNLTYVLLVGDIGQIPSPQQSGGASDPAYAQILGSDSYPEIFIGRFSAQTIAQLETQINRTLQYERFPTTGVDWYANGTGIASDDGYGTGDDNEWDWEHLRNIRTDLLNFTYTHVDEFYEGSQSGEDAPGNPTASMVTTAVNFGRGFINYCGHGGTTNWVTTGFSNSDVNALVNDNKLPFIISVACKSGNFAYSSGDCFSEAWMKATHNGVPTGAIGHYASTINQNWNPPMDAQDEITDLLVSESKQTMGGLCFNGIMHMLDEYPYEGVSDANTWTLLGDPSLVVRTADPMNISVNHDDIIVEGDTTFDISIPGVENALCSITSDGTILGTNHTDSNGEGVIIFDDIIEDIDNVTLVVTAFNSLPYQTTIDVIPAVRQPAEFEPMESVLIRYPFGIPYDLISALANQVELITIVTGASQQTTVESLYTNNGVNLSNCSFIYAPTNSYWTRDYGPWFRFNTTTNALDVVDFTYNRPQRPDDNDIPGVFALNQSLSYDFMNLQHTGGNYMTDGHGIAMSTTLVHSENSGYSTDEINQIMRNHLGIKTYHVVDDALGSSIEHIDCWAKLLSPDTIMITEVPSSSSIYADLEAAVTYFENQLSCYGTPYDVVRVYAPNGEPYTNSLIVNDKVFVPQMGTSWDDDALISYTNAMPGYTVLGFDSGSGPGWQTIDAIHCRTKGIPDENMIYIDHDPLNDRMPVDPGFLVEAEIIRYNTSRDVNSVNLHWFNSTSAVWNTVPMNTSGDNVYTAYIPIHPCGETLSYYIGAESNTGESYNDPFIGGDDPFTFNVTLVPDITIDPASLSFFGTDGMQLTNYLEIGNHEIAGENLSFNVAVTDESGLGWLSVDVTNGSLLPATSVNVTVTANTTGLDVGDYEEEIKITSDDPDEPVIIIPVDLDVVLGNDVGGLTVNTPCGQQLPGTFIINATVKNYGIYNQSDVLVNCTILEGGGSLVEDFEDTNGGYTHGDGPGPGSIDDWEWGEPTYGPSSAHSGSHVWATNLDSDHSNGADGVLDSIEVDLNMFAPSPQISFWHWYDHTTYDCGNVKISTDGGITWELITPNEGYPGTASSGNQGIPNEPAFTDISSGWEQVTFNLSNYEGELVKIRWHFGSTSSSTHPGWYIDDVEFSSGIMSKGPGDIVYNSEGTVSIPANANSYIEFSPAWDVTNCGFYAIQITTMLSGDQETSNDQTTGIVEISQAPEGHVSLLKQNWSFVALPFNHSMTKDNLVVNHDGIDYEFNDAVSMGFIDTNIFGWKRDNQTYELVDSLHSGEGYWVFAYENCELKAPVFNVNYDGQITSISSEWNIIGYPNDISIHKTNVTINWQGTDYTWSEAVTQGVLDNNLLGWDNDAQSYALIDELEPGKAYWMYSYYQCILKEYI